MEAMIAIMVPVGTALTYAAYKHPKGYRRLFLAIMLLQAAAVAIYLSWTAALDTALNAVDPFIAAKDHSAAHAAIEAYRILPSAAFVATGFYIYLAVLIFLPEILGISGDD